MRIDCPVHSTSTQTVLKVLYNYIEFLPEGIEHAFEFKQQREGEEEKWLCQKSFISKNKIAAIDMNYSEAAGRWLFLINVDGCAEDYRLYFEFRAEATELYRVFKEYLTNKLDL